MDTGEESSEEDERVLRALADVDNMRKRLEREHEREVQASVQRVVLSLLPALDDLERCSLHASDDPRALREGVDLTLQQFEAALEAAGATRLGTRAGMPFDPTQHEAVARQASDTAPPNTILEVVQAGFLFGERLLRPARVVVSAAAH